MIIYDLICAAVSLFITGPEAEVAAGLAAGTLTVIFNFLLLEKVVDYIIDGTRAGFAFLIHLGRFFIFGAAACLCSAFGIHMLASYGLGVLSFTAAVAADSIYALILKPVFESKALDRVCENKREAVE